LNRDGARVCSNLHGTLSMQRLRKLPFACNRVRISYAIGTAAHDQVVRWAPVTSGGIGAGSCG